jgi:hypothetical protein
MLCEVAILLQNQKAHKTLHLGVKDKIIYVISAKYTRHVLYKEETIFVHAKTPVFDFVGGQHIFCP